MPVELMPLNLEEKEKIRKRNWYRNHIDQEKSRWQRRKKEYANTNYYKIYYENNKEKLKANRKSLVLRNQISWRKYFPEKTKCQSCGSEILFNKSNRNKAIHFDHRNEGLEPIKGSPMDFIIAHQCNPKNIALWESCNFGMLCQKCNFALPTKNRKLFVINIVKYVFGIDLTTACSLQIVSDTNGS